MKSEDLEVQEERGKSFQNAIARAFILAGSYRCLGRVLVMSQATALYKTLILSSGQDCAET